MNNTLTELERALRLARWALEQRAGIDAHIAANGPTIGEVIDRALESPQAMVERIASEPQRGQM